MSATNTLILNLRHTSLEQIHENCTQQEIIRRAGWQRSVPDQISTSTERLGRDVKREDNDDSLELDA